MKKLLGQCAERLSALSQRSGQAVADWRETGLATTAKEKPAFHAFQSLKGGRPLDFATLMLVYFLMNGSAPAADTPSPQPLFF